MRLRALLICALAAAASAMPVAGARAAFVPGAQIVSVDNATDEQADGPSLQADITPDGRYVVFQTRATNFFGDNDPDPPGELREGGIFRYDRDTGALALVADGDFVDEDDPTTLDLGGAAHPSVSANGRFVVFDTAQQLVPQDTDNFTDVYVRDMDVPLTGDRKTSGAYTLVSALDGTDTPPSWGTPAFDAPAREPGAAVWQAEAISADGSRVVFRTLSPSNLPDAAMPDTPAGQVFVRDLNTKATTLMTRNTTDGSPAGGATGPAVISGDGTTVVWAGANAPEQTVFVPGEHVDDVLHFYLWRRVDGTVTRRITGASDPDDPGCTAATPMTVSPVATGPCYGPLTAPEEESGSITGAAPALSEDGFRVAFLATGALRPANAWGTGLDLFLTDMHPGLTRKQSTIELTRDGPNADQRTAPQIQGVAMSADGAHLVIATNRVNFILPAPTLVSTTASSPRFTQLYEIDLNAMTIDRVAYALGGGDVDGDAGSQPTVSADGSLVAFTSGADDLLFGDANGQVDAFVATRAVPQASAAPPPGANSKPSTFQISSNGTAHLSATTKSEKDGSVRLTVTTPGSGTLGLVVSGKVKKHAVTFATHAPKAVKKGKTSYTLRLSSRYASLLRKGSVHASARATYQPGAGLALHKTIAIVFKKTPAKHVKPKHKSSKKTRRVNGA